MTIRAIQEIYVFKVALKDNKRIWRKIAISSKQTLDDLHKAIFSAFDRYDEHLYSFYFTESQGRSRSRLRNVPQYTHPYNVEENSFFANEKIYNATETLIEDINLKENQKFEYLFDFGDEWWHEITVEKIGSLPQRGTYPRIIEKRGESPSQYQEYD